MTPRAAVLHKVIACLAITSGLQCGAVLSRTDVFRTNITSLTPQEEGLFLAASLATIALLLAIRVASKFGAASSSWVAPSFSIPTPDDNRRSLLHAAPTKSPGFAIDRASMRSKGFGGDFFSAAPLKGQHEGGVLVVVGDVSGNGTRTAMAVFKLVQAIDALAQKLSSPGDLLAQLNSRIQGHLQGETATCLALRLAPRGRCTVASAGHPSPIVNGHELALESALPLGILPEQVYPEAHFTLGEDDFLALYTNGLSEARNHSGELFGFGRLETLFASRPSAREASQKAIEFGQRDDVTVLTVTRLRTVEAHAAESTSAPV
ncbi:MAG: PP2C family protein-serine/threonine phosphatase [Terracidiphilus sp.]|jgi:serine phosphatase RsbU (regulator of sigma subunit)